MGATHVDGRSWRPWQRISATKAAVVLIALLIVAYFALLEYSRPHVTGDPLRYSEFVDFVERDRVIDARILDFDGYVVGTYRNARRQVRRFNTPFFKSEVLRTELTDLLIPNRVTTIVDQQQSKAIIQPLIILIPSLLIIVVFAYFIITYRSGTGLFASAGRKVGRDVSTVSFADVAGQDAAVAELRDISRFLSQPERFAALGSRMPKGLLLYGPPGTGKTLLARALAGETGASFYSVSGADFVEIYVGVGAARMRELFKRAREDTPAIVFIDELDAIAARRGARMEASASVEQEQALNQLLAEMDGFSPSEGIIVLAATNRPDALDPALLRPGRFDRAIALELPGEHARQEILELHARDRPLESDVDLPFFAERTVGLTGADLGSLMNAAGIIAARDGRATIAQADLVTALSQIVEAPERQRRLSMRGATSIAQRLLGEDRVTFGDVAGAETAIEELGEVRDYLGDPDRFAALGAKIPHGFLLSGPPGCGKTLLARAIAGECNATFLSVASTEFVQRLLGEGPARVRDIFAEARGKAPTILFIDELDAIGEARGSMINDHMERHLTLDQILVELDGFTPRTGVVVIGATNRPEVLDPALIRPGRFDRHVTIDMPDAKARRAILDVHVRGRPLAGDVDLDDVARLSRGMAGADLANIVNEAALLAARRRLPEITQALLDEALERAAVGLGGIGEMSEAERYAVAHHEAGHGIVAMELPGGKALHRLTILPRGQTLGRTILPDVEDRYSHPRSLLVARMAILLGGRVAEEIVLGEPWDHASADFAEVSKLARRMVAEQGMSVNVGPINDGEAIAPNGAPLRSAETSRLIDDEVRRLVDEAAGLARHVLERRRNELERVAAELLERETLTLAEVEAIVGASAGS